MRKSLQKTGLVTALMTAALLMFAPNVGAVDAESVIERTFTVGPDLNLLLVADRGSVHITTGTSSNLKIEVRRTLRKANQQAAEPIFAAHLIEFDQDGDRIEIRAEMQKKALSKLKRNQSLEVQFFITAPAKMNLSINTSAGSIKCSDVEGTVIASTSGGSISFGAIKGDLTARTAAGSVRFSSVSGDVDAKTSGGSIQAGRVDGNARLTTSAGSIAVAAAARGLHAQTHGGSIDVGSVNEPAQVTTSAGSIRIGSAASNLVLTTSGGSISVKDAKASVTAKTSAGSVVVNFTGQPNEDSELRTSGGTIKVSIAEGLGFNLEATANGGKVTTTIPIATTVKGNQLKADINGGGKLLKLTSSAGDIEIRR